jgi:hypothetical protein
MKKYLIFSLICIVCGGGQLLAQKYQPKYLREDNKAFSPLVVFSPPTFFYEIIIL